MDNAGFQAGEAAVALSILEFDYRPSAAFVAQWGKKFCNNLHRVVTFA